MGHDLPSPSLRRGASRVVVVVGLYQGAVPLVVRSAFDGDQRFAPTLWLPAPWWWIACLAVVAVAVAVAAWLEPDAGAPAEDTMPVKRPPSIETEPHPRPPTTPCPPSCS